MTTYWRRPLDRVLGSTLTLGGWSATGWSCYPEEAACDVTLIHPSWRVSLAAR
jgi:hypothetical protein